MKRVIQIITTAIIIISVLNIINVNTVQAANNEEIMIPDLHEHSSEDETTVSVNSVESTEPVGANSKIHFIGIGVNNDAILIESNGRYGMVDSGEKEDRTDGLIGCTAQVVHYLKMHGVKQLDFYIATHAHSDHIGNAESILREFPTKKVYIGKYNDEYIYEKKNRWDNQQIYDNLVKTAKETGAELIQDFDSTNTKFSLGDLRIQIYNYERKVDQNGNRIAVWDDNVNSLITLVKSGDNTVLLTGDDTPASFAMLPDDVKNVTVLKLAHHGDPHNNTIEILEKMNPQISIQTGSTDHLSKEEYEFLTCGGRKYFSTLADQASVIVEFPINGSEKSVNVYTEKMLPDNFYKMGDYYYSFDENGRALKGTQTINGNNYLFDINGREQFGLSQINNRKMYLDLQTGCAWKNRWFLQAGRDYYYFDDNGYALKSGWYEIAGVKYYFDAEGIWVPNAKVEGWQKNTTGWWYRNYDGSYPYNVWKYIGKYYYYFDQNGYMVTGWKRINGYWYYLSDSGAMQIGWLKKGETWYYLCESGEMQTGWVYVGGSWYYMRESGEMLVGKQTLGGNIYYFTAGGQWIDTSKHGNWERNQVGYWWNNGDGTWPFNCWKKIDGYWYWFNNYGYRKSEWLVLNDGTYYLNADGIMMTGWVQVDNIWYCFDKSGRMMTGNVILGDNNKYYFNEKGQLQVGWFEYNGRTVYSNQSGIRFERSGWNLINEKWYYLDENYGRCTGWLVFNKDQENEMCYYLADDGVMVTGEQIIQGVKYYFSPSGLLRNVEQ